MTFAPDLDLNSEAPSLPFNLEAEQALLGCVMLENDMLSQVDQVQPEHFFEPLHSRLWAKIADRVNKGQRADPVALVDLFANDEAMQEMGGLRYLADLVDAAPPPFTAPTYAGIVSDLSLKRELIKAADAIGFLARKTDYPALDQLTEAERSLAELATSTAAPLAQPVGLTALENIEAAWRGEFTGTSVGLEVLDHVTNGIRQDDVWFIAGRTSMGKSVTGLALARGIAERGAGVLVFSLEMPLREVQARLIADIAFDREQTYNPEGNVTYGALLKGRGTEAQRHRARWAARQLASLPLAVTDAGGLTINDIRSQAQRQMRAWDKAGVKRGAVLIDHIGLVKPARNSGNKAADTADIVNELKGIAKQLKTPIIALAQINRNTEARNDKRPTLADMNWSGAIEQISDLICLLYRESYYLERSGQPGDWEEGQAKKHEIELLIHKNRSGPICNLKAFVDVSCNALRDPIEREERYA